jgi:hypothetical protein
MVERLTPIIKNIKQNIIKDTRKTTKINKEEIVAILIAVVKEMVIMVMEKETKVMEMENINFYFHIKKKRNCVSFFFSLHQHLTRC